MTAENWLMDSQQVAEALAVSPRWLRYAVAGGRVPGVCWLGPKCLRFDRAKLQAWVASGCPDLRQAAAGAGNPAGGSVQVPACVHDVVVDELTTALRDANNGTTISGTDYETSRDGAGSAGGVSAAGAVAAGVARGCSGVAAAVPAGVRSSRSGSGGHQRACRTDFARLGRRACTRFGNDSRPPTARPRDQRNRRVVTHQSGPRAARRRRARL